MRAASIACTVAGIWMAASGWRRRYRPRSPASALVSTSVRTLSSTKNGFPSLDQQLLERGEARDRRPAAHPAGRRRSPAAARPGGAGCSRSCPPRRAGTRAVVHEQEQPGGTEALDQAVQQRLGLAVDPVEVLEDQHERLLARLPEKQALHAVERLPPPLRRAAVCHAGSSTGTSSRDRSAGRVGSSARSRARSLPVTFSRISRRSSRSWTLK